ncbi:MAG: hypothetical protein BGN96_06975 [Bacteroidales bacterium 45-6]|nr:MAG: hypothetical protein BGN96_06975 [Bacteroidales bacterium 45-6]
MKVLTVYDVRPVGDNPFVELLCEHLSRAGVDMTCSVSEFWDSTAKNYDVIHFHWPEEVVGWNCEDSEIPDRLRTRVNSYKQAGVKIVYTRHNIGPHYPNKVIEQAYRIIEEESDVVVHMAGYSLCEFQKKYPDSKNSIIPHHIYEGRYDQTTSQAEARTSLGIPADAYVVVTFGKFRNWTEVRMVLRAFLNFQCRNKYLLASRLLPFFSKDPHHRGFFKRTISQVGYRMLVPALGHFCVLAGANDVVMEDRLLSLQLIASDLVFIQRKQILNSGNLPLAFLFGKAVVGPNVGNVGEILEKTGNPVFDPMVEKTIAIALQEAKAKGEDLGSRNFEYALSNWKMAVVAQKYVDLYDSLTNPIIHGH